MATLDRERVTIPVAAKTRIGHFAEAPDSAGAGSRVHDESEVLGRAEVNRIDKLTSVLTTSS
jgi:pyridoxal biosynthesis lyase PdxS